MKLYNVVSIIERINAETVLNPTPMSFEQACAFKAKFTNHHGRVLMLREVSDGS